MTSTPRVLLGANHEATAAAKAPPLSFKLRRPTHVRRYFQIQLVATLIFAALLIVGGAIWGALIDVLIGLAIATLAYVAYRALFDHTA